MDAWLRPSFLRKNTTPIIPSSNSFNERPASSRSEKEVDVEDGRLRAGSRASSLMNLLTTSPLALTAPDIWPNISKADAVWDNPSPDQMADMLKVAMMTQSTMEPLPIHFNSCILHVVEEYWNLREQTKVNESKIEGLKENHRRDIDEFEAISNAWEETEKNYKAEVKRLEVLLSKTQGGMASVAMARSKSLLHGSKRASQIIRDGIGTIRQRNDVDKHQVTLEAVRNNRQQNHDRYKEPYQRKDNVNGDTLAKLTPPDHFEIARRTRRNFGMNVPDLETKHNTDGASSYLWGNSVKIEAEDKVESEPLSHSLSTEQPEEYQNQKSSRDRSNSFGSTSNSTSSGVPDYSSEDEDSDELTMASQSILGLGIVAERPASPKRPTIVIPATERRESATLERYSSAPDAVPVEGHTLIGPRQMSFSFVPGANEILSHAAEVATANEPSRLKDDDNLHLQVCTQLELPDEIRNGNRSSANPAPRGDIHAKLAATPQIRRPRLELQRDDSNHSTSSVVTAVRHNSGHSSVGGSYGGSRHHSPSQNSVQSQRRQSGRDIASGSLEKSSNEALTAATRAIAANARKK